MQDLYENLKKLKFDKRMIKWNINKKVLTPKEYEKHLNSLKDISHLQNTEKVESEDEGDSEEKSQEIK